MGSGALEALKWIALALMLGDHVDAAFFNRNYWILSEAGRIAMPLFAAVFGYNLLRIAGDAAKLAKLRNKLLIVGLIAWPFHTLAVSHSWWTVNILFAFAVAVQLAMWAQSDLHKNMVSILALFLVTGLFLEFAWVAPALVLTWAMFFKRPTVGGGLALLSCYLGLAMINGNWWGLLSVPLIVLAIAADPRIPRIRQVFWIFYPAHLLVLAMLVLSPVPYVPMVSVPPIGAINL